MNNSFNHNDTNFGPSLCLYKHPYYTGDWNTYKEILISGYKAEEGVQF